MVTMICRADIYYGWMMTFSCVACDADGTFGTYEHFVLQNQTMDGLYEKYDLDECSLVEAAVRNLSAWALFLQMCVPRGYYAEIILATENLLESDSVQYYQLVSHGVPRWGGLRFCIRSKSQQTATFQKCARYRNFWHRLQSEWHVFVTCCFRGCYYFKHATVSEPLGLCKSVCCSVRDAQKLPWNRVRMAEVGCNISSMLFGRLNLLALRNAKWYCIASCFWWTWRT